MCYVQIREGSTKHLVVAPWLFVTDPDVLSLQRYKHGEDVVKGRLIVIPGTLNARAIILANYIRTGRLSTVCFVVGIPEAVRTQLANLLV